MTFVEIGLRPIWHFAAVSDLLRSLVANLSGLGSCVRPADLSHDLSQSRGDHHPQLSHSSRDPSNSG